MMGGISILRCITRTFRAISASRCVETPSRRRRASSLGEEVVGGLFFDVEAVRTASSEYDAPRRSVSSN